MKAAVGVVAFAGFWAYSVLSKTTPEEKLAALEKEVKPKGGSIFRAVLMDKPVIFLLLDCSVYLLEITPDEIKRNRVLTTGFYFGLAGCTDQSIAMEDGYVRKHERISWTFGPKEFMIDVWPTISVWVPNTHC